MVPQWCDQAVFAIGSGLGLLLVVLAWQQSGTVLLQARGPVRWACWTVQAAALIGLAVTVRALRSFDLFGSAPIRVHLCGTQLPRSMSLVITGPYRWVRHPIYAWILLLIWTTANLTADRLLFDLVWTAWIVAGSHWEERDLVAGFGPAYHRYQSRTPMLLPWRGRTVVEPR